MCLADGGVSEMVRRSSLEIFHFKPCKVSIIKKITLQVKCEYTKCAFVKLKFANNIQQSSIDGLKLVVVASGVWGTLMK